MIPLPLVKITKKIPRLGPLKEPPPLWASSGVREKPAACRECPFRTSGSGFVADWLPDSVQMPKLGFLLSFPTSSDVLEQRPWSGAAGFAWEKRYLQPFGLKLHDVFVGNVLRCQPKERRFGKPVYPTGDLKRRAELACRAHDHTCWGGASVREGGIERFNPNLFVITFDPYDGIQTPALTRLILKDIGKAVTKMKEGLRPLVLMGDEARELVAPWTSKKGGTKSWRGHWWAGKWPFVEGSNLVEPGFGFMEA